MLFRAMLCFVRSKMYHMAPPRERRFACVEDVQCVPLKTLNNCWRRSAPSDHLWMKNKSYGRQMRWLNSRLLLLWTVITHQASSPDQHMSYVAERRPVLVRKAKQSYKKYISTTRGSWIDQRTREFRFISCLLQAVKKRCPDYQLGKGLKAPTIERSNVLSCWCHRLQI